MSGNPEQISLFKNVSIVPFDINFSFFSAWISWFKSLIIDWHCHFNCYYFFLWCFFFFFFFFDAFFLHFTPWVNALSKSFTNCSLRTLTSSSCNVFSLFSLVRSIFLYFRQLILLFLFVLLRQLNVSIF